MSGTQVEVTSVAVDLSPSIDRREETRKKIKEMEDSEYLGRLLEGLDREQIPDVLTKHYRDLGFYRKQLLEFEIM